MTTARLLGIFALSAALLLPACQRESKRSAQAGDSDSQALEKPGDVVATLQLPSGTKLTSLAKAVDNIQPGTSAMMSEGLPMALGQVSGVDFSAADLTQPIAIVLLNPKKFDKPVAILVKPSDRAALEASAKSAGMTLQSKDGLALVGEASAVKAASEAAFGHLAKTPNEMVARVYPSALATAYKDDLHQAIGQMVSLIYRQQGKSSGTAAMMVAYEEMILAIGDQTEYVEMRVGTGDGVSDFLLRLQPRAKTTMAALAAAQVPSAHGLVGKLPANSSGTMLFSGDMRAGAARQPMIDFSMKIMSVVLPSNGGADLTKLFGKWFEALDGQMAMSMNMNMSDPLAPKADATYLMGANDSDEVRKSWRGILKMIVANTKDGSMDMMGMKVAIDFKERALDVDGVEVDRYVSQVELAGLNGEAQLALKAAKVDQTMHFAAFDKLVVMAMSDDSEKTIASAIAAARGKSPGYKPPAAIAAAIKRSTKRGESMVMTMNLAAIVPAGAPPMPFSLITMGFGENKGALVWRISVRK